MELAPDMARPPVDSPPLLPPEVSSGVSAPPTCANPDFYSEEIWSQGPGAGNAPQNDRQDEENEFPSDISSASSGTSDSEGSDDE